MTAASDLLVDPHTVIAGLAAKGITTTEYVYSSLYIVPSKTELAVQSPFARTVRGNQGHTQLTRERDDRPDMHLRKGT